MDIKQMYSYMKTKSYTYSKDDLGSYFDKDGIKFSIMKNGLWFICYHNVKVDGNWQLYSKSQMFEKFPDALFWVVKESQKIL